MQQNQDDEQVRFSNLAHDVRLQLDISWTEYVLLDMVYHLSAKYGFCFMSKTVMAQRVGVTYTGLKKMIARLENRELLVPDARGLVCGQAYLDIAYLKKAVKTSESELSSKNYTKFKKVNSVQKSELSTVEIYNKNNNRNISTNVLVDSAKPNATELDVTKKLELFFYMLVKALGFSETVRYTEGRKRKLKSRLRTYKGSEILQAATTLGGDAYMQGDNDKGKRYGDIDYLLRSDEIIDKYLNAGAEVSLTEGAF